MAISKVWKSPSTEKWCKSLPTEISHIVTVHTRCYRAIAIRCEGCRKGILHKKTLIATEPSRTLDTGKANRARLVVINEE